MLTGKVNIAVFAAFRPRVEDAIRSIVEFKRLCWPHERDIACFGWQKRHDLAAKWQGLARSAAKTAPFGRGAVVSTLPCPRLALGASGASASLYGVVQVPATPGGAAMIERIYHRQIGMSSGWACGKRDLDQVCVAAGGAAVAGMAFTGCRRGSSTQKTLPLPPRRARTPILP